MPNLPVCNSKRLKRTGQQHRIFDTGFGNKASTLKSSTQSTRCKDIGPVAVTPSVELDYITRPRGRDSLSWLGVYELCDMHDWVDLSS